MSSVFLVGMPGSGKSLIGTLVADMLHRDFFDCDTVLELREGRKIREIFGSDGECCFRDLEESVLRSLGKQQAAIIATGGGVVLRKANRDYLREQRVAFIDCSIRDLVARTGSTNHRPLLAGGNLEERLEDLSTKRQVLYEEVASKTFTSMSQEPRKLANELTRWILKAEQQ